MMLGQSRVPATGPATGPATSTPAATEGGYPHARHPTATTPQATIPLRRKRKAEQDVNNERLHKRMSLLNLEHNGPRLYVPVEQPQLQQQPAPAPAPNSDPAAAPTIGEEPMQLDDTKHKVYVYNLDDELSSDNESEPGDREGRLAFLPDIEKHLRLNRIPVPRPIVPNKDGELAGMQIVLYSDGPSSITVPEEQDGVRKAVLEARARVRQKQAEARGETNATAVKSDVAKPTKVSFATPVKFTPPPLAHDDIMSYGVTGQSSASALGSEDAMVAEYDPDAMDLD